MILDLLGDRQRRAIKAFITMPGGSCVYDGAVRSGKSVAAIIAFLSETQSPHQRHRAHIVAGRNLNVMKAELLDTMEKVCRDFGADYQYRATDGRLTIDKVRYYVLAGTDDAAYERLRSMTAGCVLAEEVTLMPQSFYNELQTRMTFDDSKLIATCNPGGPNHWFLRDHILGGRVEERWQFTLDDNPALGEKTKDRYANQFAGVFYQRNIEGIWAAAEGQIFDRWTMCDPVKPEECHYHVCGIDYGIASKTAFVLTAIRNSDDRRVVVDTLLLDGQGRAFTDAELLKRLMSFLMGKKCNVLYIDPSATSFIHACRESPRDWYVRNANNNVLDGIQTTMNALATGNTLICDTEGNRDLVNEFHGYIWDQKAAERGIERPIKADDHACDALRYVLHSLNRQGGAVIQDMPVGMF